MKAAATITAVILGGVACDESATPSVSAGPEARDYCRELGFIGGVKHDDADSVVEECSLGPTPNGGAYSIARYLDGGEPATKDEALAVEIVEYDSAGNVIETTYGDLGG